MIQMSKGNPSADDDQSAIRRVSVSLRAMETELGKLTSAKEAINRTNAANQDIANNILKYYEELRNINNAYSDILNEYEQNRTLAANLVEKEAEIYADKLGRLMRLSDNVVDHVVERTKTAVQGLEDAINAVGTTLTGMGAKMSCVSDGIGVKIKSVETQLTTLSDDIRRGTTINEIQKLNASVQALTEQVERHGSISDNLEKQLGHLASLAKQIDAIRETTVGLSNVLDEIRKESLKTIKQTLEDIGRTVKHGDALLQNMQEVQQRQERTITTMLEDIVQLGKELRDHKADNTLMMETTMSTIRERIDKTDQENARLIDRTVKHGDALLQHMQEVQQRQEQTITTMLENVVQLGKELRDQKTDNIRMMETTMSTIQERIDKADLENARLMELVQGCTAIVEDRLPQKKKWFS